MMQFKHVFSLIAIFVVGASAVFAQPTLQNNVFPSVGETVTTAEASDSNAVTEGAAGANITWNFAVLQAASGTVTTTNFQSPSGTPYEPFYPTSNLCGVIFDVDNFYTYYQKSSTEFLGLGFAAQDFTLTYNNPQTLMKAPLSFNGSFNDTYNGNLDAGGILISVSGERESMYDAYGTLVMPTGTYTNVIRMKSVATDVDTVDFGGLLNISEIITTSYEWYAADVPGPVVTISYSEGTSTSVIPGFPPEVEDIPLEKSITFTTTFSTGVAEVAQLNGINLAFRGANPVADVLSLDIETATAGEKLQLQVFSRNGQLVSTQNITTNGATLHVDVPVADCRPGLYFVSLTNGNARLSKGFVKM